MNVSHPPVVFEDHRGEIIDVVDKVDFQYATLIRSRKDVERGNHFHKKTVQYEYVLTGKIRALTRKNNAGPVESRDLVPGDLVCHEAGEAHTLIALEDSTFLVLTSGERGGKNYENDTYRLDQPLSSLL